MGDFGIRISKDGVDVKTTLTDANKKDFVFLSEESSPKVYYAGFLTGSGSGVSYSHNLGYVPMFFMFEVDSTTVPSYYRAVGSMATSTTTVIEEPFIEKAYLIILNEGN